MHDYRSQVSSDESEGKRVKKVCEFFDERYVKYRSITDIDWSPKVRSTVGAAKVISDTVHFSTPSWSLPRIIRTTP